MSMSNTPDQTLLHHLLCNGYDPADYLDALDGIADSESAKEGYAEHPEEYDAEAMSFVDDDIEDWYEELNRMKENWNPELKPDMDEEIRMLREYVKNQN